MKNPFSGLFRARDKPRDAVSSAPSFFFGTSSSGKSVTPSSAVQVSAVYACVRVIAETIASLPVHVYEITDNGSRKATEHAEAFMVQRCGIPMTSIAVSFGGATGSTPVKSTAKRPTSMKMH